MARMRRTLMQSVASPVLSTSLYFVVFGAAIGSRVEQIDGIGYGAFIVPGLIMMAVLVQSVSNGAFGIYMPKFSGTIYELLSAPVSATEIMLGYVGAAACKSVILGLWMLAFLLLTSVAFSLLGFILGVWADSFEKLQVVPLMLVQPLAFLGGTFYSIHMLASPWQQIALFNPVVYLVSGFRWSFFGSADVGVGISLGITLLFLLLCLGIVTWIFRSGYKLRA
jgi:ABC-2 type transport system permease protein